MIIAIICVNYNSYKELNSYLKSIERASSFSQGKGELVQVNVMVADNSIIKEELPIDYHYINVTYYKYENLGYLGGAFAVINSLSLTEREEYDYIIISNVDVSVNNDFFSRLAVIEKENNNIGWIAPAIYSTRLGFVESVEKIERPSLKRMKLYSFLYAHPRFYQLYRFAARTRLKTVVNNIKEPQIIYAGYGSFMIFSGKFFSRKEQWHYEPFLFGEELYFAEEVKRAGYTVMFYPDLIINDKGKVSTGKLATQEQLKMQKNSNDYLLKEFFVKSKKL